MLLANLASRLQCAPRSFVSEHPKPLSTHVADSGFPSDHAPFTWFLALTVWAYSKQFVGVLLLAVRRVGTLRVASHVRGLQDTVDSFASLPSPPSSLYSRHPHPFGADFAHLTGDCESRFVNDSHGNYGDLTQDILIWGSTDSEGAVAKVLCPQPGLLATSSS